MQFHVARQPIFDRKMQVYAYELLYRQMDTDGAYKPSSDVSDDQASSSVIFNSFYNINIQEMTGGRPAFINFTANLINMEIATLLPPQTLVVEILETVKVTPEIVRRCQELKAQGYRIALDDFIPHENAAQLVRIADIIKIDFLSLSIAQIRHIMHTLKRPGLLFLAEKVETQDAFQQALKMGFDFFQGYFFSRPVIVSGEDLRPLPSNCLRLMQMVHRPEISFRAVERVVMQDVSLSYQLLKLVNSVGFGFHNRILTIHHALVALGTIEVRKWITFISMMHINRQGAKELHRQSLIRAKFCEFLATSTRLGGDPSSLFFTGLFSLMDVITNRSYESIFHDIKVDSHTADALIRKTGPYYPHLLLATSYERGDWKRVEDFSRGLNVSTDLLGDAYRRALLWCDQILEIDSH